MVKPPQAVPMKFCCCWKLKNGSIKAYIPESVVCSKFLLIGPGLWFIYFPWKKGHDLCLSQINHKHVNTSDSYFEALNYDESPFTTDCPKPNGCLRFMVTILLGPDPPNYRRGFIDRLRGSSVRYFVRKRDPSPGGTSEDRHFDRT